MSVGRLAGRAVIGGLFIGHGGEKLFGWFGGPGRAGTEGMMESLQMRPAKVHALAAGISETAGGALLVTGLATPLAAATLTGVMTTAIRKVHAPNGPWATNGGWEYNAVLIAAVTALAETGAGRRGAHGVRDHRVRRSWPGSARCREHGSARCRERGGACDGWRPGCRGGSGNRGRLTSLAASPTQQQRRRRGPARLCAAPTADPGGGTQGKGA